MTTKKTKNVNVSRRKVVSGAMALTLGCASGAVAAPAAKLLDSRWTRFGQSAGPSHGVWGAELAKAVKRGSDGINRVAYRRLSGANIASYISELSAIDPAGLNRSAAMCYWINLYNAVTVDVVLEAYPVSSIRRVKGGVFRLGPWRTKLVTVAGQKLSLDDIEHGILRPVWRDPRIHYAVNCAALGCPDLASQAYTAQRLERMLNAGAERFVNHPRGVAARAGRLEVSSIYHWFASDFGGSDRAVINHLRQYAKPALRTSLGAFSRIDGHSYDWALNDV